jgi:hypothetical protein
MFKDDLQTIRKAFIESLTSSLGLAQRIEERFANERAFFIEEVKVK